MSRIVAPGSPDRPAMLPPAPDEPAEREDRTDRAAETPDAADAAGLLLPRPPSLLAIDTFDSAETTLPPSPPWVLTSRDSGRYSFCRDAGDRGLPPAAAAPSTRDVPSSSGPVQASPQTATAIRLSRFSYRSFQSCSRATLASLPRRW